jgi:hypothetical protein
MRRFTQCFLLRLALGDLAPEECAAGMVLWRICTTAAMWIARFSRRFPDRFNRCRCWSPDDTAIGAVPE